MPDEEILSPGLLKFPNEGEINVHHCSSEQVYFARRMPGSADWECMRTSVDRFLIGVRLARGYRDA